MCMGRDARHAHGGACSGPSAWRPASVEAPVARVDKVAHAANSAQVRMRLRSRLRLAKVARVVDAIDFGPWRNGGGSVPAAAHSLREFQRAIVRWRAGSLPNLGFSTALCGTVQVHRRPTCGGRVNPGYGDPDRRTSVVQLRAMARRRGAVCRSWVSGHTGACMQVGTSGGRDRLSTIEKRRWD